MITVVFYLVFYTPMQILWRSAWTWELPPFTWRVFRFNYSWFWIPSLILAATDLFLKTWWWCAIVGTVVIVVPSRFLFGEYFEAKWIPGFVVTSVGAAVSCWSIVRLF